MGNSSIITISYEDASSTARKYEIGSDPGAKRPSLLIEDRAPDYTDISTGLNQAIAQAPAMLQTSGGFRDEIDPAAPMKEAAMFYGLFLRGHNIESLRRDIDVPKATLEKWLGPRRFEPNFRENLRRMYHFRKQVLAIFDELVLNERNRARLQ